MQGQCTLEVGIAAVVLQIWQPEGGKAWNARLTANTNDLIVAREQFVEMIASVAPPVIRGFVRTRVESALPEHVPPTGERREGNYTAAGISYVIDGERTVIELTGFSHDVIEKRLLVYRVGA